jgi:hypothetical protein
MLVASTRQHVLGVALPHSPDSGNLLLSSVRRVEAWRRSIRSKMGTRPLGWDGVYVPEGRAQLVGSDPYIAKGVSVHVALSPHHVAKTTRPKSNRERELPSSPYTKTGHQGCRRLLQGKITRFARGWVKPALGVLKRRAQFRLKSRQEGDDYNRRGYQKHVIARCNELLSYSRMSWPGR